MGSFTPEQFNNWYASAEFKALMDAAGWSFECADFNATFFPCPYPYVPTDGNWTWDNASENVTFENGPCQIPFAQLDGVKTGVLIQKLVWFAFFGSTSALMVYRLLPMFSQKKKINSVQICVSYALVTSFLGMLRMIDFAGGNDIMPYFLDGIFVNVQVALLLCILYTITNSWVAVMSSKGRRAKVPRKWKMAYRIWVTLTIFVNLSAPIVESAPPYEGMALATYFGAPKVVPYLGWFGSGYGMFRLVMNVFLCLTYATACFLFGLGIAKKLNSTSTNDTKTEATRRQVAQIRKYQMGIQLVVVLASGYWMMKFFSYMGSPHVFTPPVCSMMGGLIDISTCIVSIAIVVCLVLLNPRKKRKRKIGANGQTLQSETSSASEGSTQETSAA